MRREDELVCREQCDFSWGCSSWSGGIDGKHVCWAHTRCVVDGYVHLIWKCGFGCLCF